MRHRSKPRDPGLSAVIEAAGGSLPKLTDLLVRNGIEITTSAVAQWSRVPGSRCLAVESLTGVSRYKLRPDIFGADPNAKGKRPKPSVPRQETSRVA